MSDDFKDGSAFFGFMGVSVALVLASIFKLIFRYGSCLWYSESRNWN